ncbi:MAG: polysaccharide biosynthesis tyrosine autokinase [Rhodobacteraceae bacterium]|nr:polysaccharide biosynthesis tyrosine autokinase [Paracoccaceae bacterium]
MSAPDTAPAPADDEIDLGRLIAVLWAGKMWIALVAVLALALGVAVALMTPPTWQADALLQLEKRGGNLALPESMTDLFGEAPESVTEIEILRSRLILGQAVAELNLDWRAEPRRLPVIGHALMAYDLPLPDFGFLTPFARRGAAIRLEFLEVPPEWLGEEMVLTRTGADSFRIRLVDGSTHDGRIGEPLRVESAGFAIRVGLLTGGEGTEYLVRQVSEAVAIADLRGALSVSERGRNSGVLEVRVTAPDPARAERMLNAVTEAYVRQNIARSAAEAESSLRFIEAQLPEARAAVTAAEEALNAFRQAQQSVDLSFETQALLTQISKIENELTALQAQEDDLSQRYTPNHPEYRLLLGQRARLEDQLAGLRAEVADLPTTQREVLNLTRDLEVAQQIYTQLLTRAQEVGVLRASTVGNVRIVDDAQTAPAPIAPRRSLIVALALVLGLIAGTALVLVRQWLRKGIQSGAEIEALGVPVFATVNHAPAAVAARGRERRGKLPILALSDPSDLAVEAFRSLRTGLHFGMVDAASHSVAIVSAAPEAGKSFTAVNLAVVAAQAGQSVLLIDADLRRGQLRRYFGVARNTPGLAELLAGEAGLDEATVEGPVPGLSFLPSGRYPPNPSELLMRRTLAEMLAEADGRFDLTILDCPPVLAVTDPVIVARAAGSTLAVVRYDVTRPAELAALRRALEQGGARVTGAVLNGFDPRRAKAGYSYHYAYNYRYDYRKRAD